MQKTILGGVLILCALSAQTQTNRNTAPAIYIGAADIQATLKKAPADSVTDQAIRTVGVGNLNVGVAVVHRSAKAAQTSVAHDELTEIYHILAGSGTLVTGGTLTKPERFPADSHTGKELAGPSMRGTTLEHGVSLKVRAGDLGIIPPGPGHRSSSIGGALHYECM